MSKNKRGPGIEPWLIIDLIDNLYIFLGEYPHSVMYMDENSYWLNILFSIYTCLISVRSLVSLLIVGTGRVSGLDTYETN